MRDVPLEKQTEYAVEDADITFQLKKHFEKELTEAQTQKLFDEIEIPLVQVLADMELEGINLDQKFLNSLSEELNADILSLEQKSTRKPVKNLISVRQNNWAKSF